MRRQRDRPPEREAIPQALIRWPRRSATTAWWDHTWNPVGGCSRLPRMHELLRRADRRHETWPYARSARLHDGVTIVKDKRRIFNGKLTVAPDGHHLVEVAA